MTWKKIWEYQNLGNCSKNTLEWFIEKLGIFHCTKDLSDMFMKFRSKSCFPKKWLWRRQPKKLPSICIDFFFYTQLYFYPKLAINQMTKWINMVYLSLHQFALVAWWCFKMIRVRAHNLAFFLDKLTNHSSCFTRRLRIRLGQLIIISLISKAIEDLVCKAPNHSLHQVEWLGASYDSQS